MTTQQDEIAYKEWAGNEMAKAAGAGLPYHSPNTLNAWNGALEYAKEMSQDLMAENAKLVAENIELRVSLARAEIKADKFEGYKEHYEEEMEDLKRKYSGCNEAFEC